VREWLKGLEPDERKVLGEDILGEDIKEVEFSWPIGMPLVGSLGRELWEVRSSLPRGRIARVLFCMSRVAWRCCTLWQAKSAVLGVTRPTAAIEPPFGLDRGGAGCIFEVNTYAK
jgi:hypothetical protein